MKKMPPIEKIPEAYSAIADNRIEMDAANEMAHVFSSDRTKAYTVTWKDSVYTSNDNSSYWQGAVGYPMIAVLLLQGKLPLNPDIVALFKDINWKNINTRHKNKYDRALAEVFHDLAMQGIDLHPIENNFREVYADLENLPLKTKKSSLLPPTGKETKGL
ncbi:MAG: hypothetical protein RR303_01560 [Bacteroidales bacterium]